MSSVQRINHDLHVYFNEHVGCGAFGMVYKGMYKKEVCAVKMLHHVAMPLKANFPVGRGKQDIIDKFDYEISILQSLEHPNVLQLLATTKHPESGNALLVTELMDCNLSTYLSTPEYTSFLTSQCEISLSKDLASGLAYIHSRKIIHRDLCGDNVLINRGQVFPIAKISDFGMSKLLDPLKFNATIAYRKGYLPPEALHEEDENYNESLDVFSCGVIMIQIACRLETVHSGRERSTYIEEIKASTHTLKPHIIACLKKDKKLRPSATVVCGQLKRHLLCGEAYRQDYDHFTFGGEQPSIPGPPANQVTLQELIRRYSLTDEQLNTEIGDSDIPMLAWYFNDVMTYPCAMQLTPNETSIVSSHLISGTPIAMKKCLEFWTQHDPSRATYRALLDIILGLGKGDTADIICYQYLIRWCGPMLIT